MKSISLKISIILLSATLGFSMSGCNFNIEPTIVRGGNIDWSVDFPDPDEVKYFDTIEEAIANNVVWRSERYYESLEEARAEGRAVREGPTEIIQSVKYLEHDNMWAFFFTTQNRLYEDAIAVYMGYLREEGEQRQYSAAIWDDGIPFVLYLSQVRFAFDEIAEVRMNLNLRRFHQIDPDKNFRWGLHRSSNVRYLEIDGQPVDGVVPVEVVEGRQLYFWYFEDLRPENLLNFRNISESREGEAVITMIPE